MSICKDCHQDKVEEDFYTYFDKRDQIMRTRSTCKSCLAEQQVKYKLKLQKEYGLDLQNLLKYGITFEDFSEAFIRQSGNCAICKRKLKLHVDHDHDTKVLRGLLCGSCNRALGLLQDSTEIIEQALFYLRLTKGRKPNLLNLINQLEITSKRR